MDDKKSFYRQKYSPNADLYQSVLSDQDFIDCLYRHAPYSHDSHDRVWISGNAFRERNKKNREKVAGETFFSLTMLFIFAVCLYLCKDWSVKARLFPLLIGITGSVFSIWLLFSDIYLARSLETRESNDDSDRPKDPLKVYREKPSPKREGIMIMWVLGFLGMILFFGFWISIALFTPLFMVLFGREKWQLVAIYTLGIWLAMYLIFTMGMEVSLYGGLLGLSL